jgi:hypothetical protein
MKKQPRVDYDEKTADDVLKQLYLATLLLASDAHEQVASFSHQPVVITDEMALDFDNWFLVTKAYWILSKEEESPMDTLNKFLDRMSEKPTDRFWTTEALFTDKRWEEIRKISRNVIDVLEHNINKS